MDTVQDTSCVLKDIIYDHGLLHFEAHVYPKPPPMRDKHVVISNAFVSDASFHKENYRLMDTVQDTSCVLSKTINNADGSDVSISHRIARNNPDNSDVTISHSFVLGASGSNTSNTQNSNADDCEANSICGSLESNDTTDKEDDGKDSADTAIDAMFDIADKGNAYSSSFKCQTFESISVSLNQVDIDLLQFLLADPNGDFAANVHNCLDDNGINGVTVNASITSNFNNNVLIENIFITNYGESYQTYYDSSTVWNSTNIILTFFCIIYNSNIISYMMSASILNSIKMISIKPL